MTTKNHGTIYIARDEVNARRLCSSARSDGESRIVFSRDELEAARAYQTDPEFNFNAWLHDAIRIKQVMPSSRCVSVEKSATPGPQTVTTFAQTQEEFDNGNQTELF